MVRDLRSDAQQAAVGAVADLAELAGAFESDGGDAREDIVGADQGQTARFPGARHWVLVLGGQVSTSVKVDQVARREPHQVQKRIEAFVVVQAHVGHLLQLRLGPEGNAQAGGL